MNAAQVTLVYMIVHISYTFTKYPDLEFSWSARAAKIDYESGGPRQFYGEQMEMNLLIVLSFYLPGVTLNLSLIRINLMAPHLFYPWGMFIDCGIS